MNTDDLFEAVRKDEAGAENRLLEHLRVRFLLMAHLKIGCREDAEEVVQDALAAIARDYRGIEFGSFRAWAYKVFDYRLLNYIGTKARHAGERPVSIDEEAATGGLAGDPDLRRRLLDCLRKVRAANRRYARILNLSYQGFAATEVCGRLGVTRENMYMVLSRARAMLKRCLQTGDIT